MKTAISFEQSESMFVGMILNKEIKGKRLTRLTLSNKEIDDTTKPSKININTRKRLYLNDYKSRKLSTCSIGIV